MEAQSGSLRESLNRWNESRGQSSLRGVGENAKSYLSRWAESINESTQGIYQRLPLTQHEMLGDNEPKWFALSMTERIALFACFILGAAGCFIICFMMFPVLAVKPRKFGLLWCMGSLLFVLAFGVFQGPRAYTKHLVSRDRLPFTVCFFGSCLLTMYFAAFMKSTMLTIPSAIVQFVAVVYYAVSYFPFGGSGLRMIGSYGINSAWGALRI